MREVFDNSFCEAARAAQTERWRGLSVLGYVGTNPPDLRIVQVLKWKSRIRRAGESLTVRSADKFTPE